MPLLKNNVLVADTWINAEAEGELPAAGDVIVPFALLLKDWGELSKMNLSMTDQPACGCSSQGSASVWRSVQISASEPRRNSPR